MGYEVVLSPFMDNQVPTKPPKEGFATYLKAERWVYQHYGSTAINNYINGVNVGCNIVERE